MTFSEKIKITTKSRQTDLDRQIAKISTLSSGNVCEYELLTGKSLLGKAATIKKFKYLPIGSELKKQTDIAKDQYKL